MTGEKRVVVKTTDEQSKSSNSFQDSLLNKPSKSLVTNSAPKMQWQSIKDLPSADFRKLTGVKDTTFKAMVDILQIAHNKKKSLGGRPNKLCVEDMLLMTIEHLIENKTYAHISKNYGFSESNIYKIINWVDDALVASNIFSLPEHEVIAVDTDEHSG